MFFSCETTVNTAVTLPGFDPERKPTSRKSLPVRKCNTGFIEPLFFVYGLLSPVNDLLTWLETSALVSMLHHSNTSYSAFNVAHYTNL